MIVPLPLNEQSRTLVAHAFQGVERHDLSIQAAIENGFGTVHVDDATNPAVFRLEMPPFWYFAGDVESPIATEMMRELPPGIFLMPTAPEWIELVQRLFGERLQEYYRFSYSADSLPTEHLEALLANSKYRDAIRPIDLALAEQAWNTPEHFIDMSLFRSAKDFIERGIGFFCEQGGKLIGAAYSQLVCSRGIEVSIFVEERYRQRGVATALGAKLALACLERGWEPHWDAANSESCKLAEKLGYTRSGMYTAYYLEQ